MTTTVELRLRFHFVMDLSGTKGSFDDEEIDVEPGHTSKAKDAQAISPPAWALLRNVQRGHLQTQRESCDRPTALPTVSVFSCHSPSHASPAKHRAPSTVLSPLSVPSHPLLPSGQVRLDALWLFDPKLVVHFGLFWVLFLCLADMDLEVKEVLSGRFTYSRLAFPHSPCSALLQAVWFRR